ncbi:hypothetical protein C8J56DRAFT_1131017 [Mycena floridula]|nr:hypothetical protein C8J56DRAFT_1131017 [Mycena floridula]
MVPEDDVVDELWRDYLGRRKIRLGIWSTPFTKEIDDALSPYQAILIQLLDAPDDVPAAAVPALRFLNPDLEHSNKRHKHAGRKWWQEALPFLGDLSVKDCAGINNWFASIPAIKECDIDWLESLAICHARTLLIMARKRPEFLCEPDCPSPVTDSL